MAILSNLKIVDNISSVFIRVSGWGGVTDGGAMRTVIAYRESFRVKKVFDPKNYRKILRRYRKLGDV
jgi:hypothetical protein